MSDDLLFMPTSYPADINIRERLDNALRSLESRGFTVIFGSDDDEDCGGIETSDALLEKEIFEFAFYTANDARRYLNEQGRLAESASIPLHFMGAPYIVLFELERAGVAAHLHAAAPHVIEADGGIEQFAPADNDYKRLIAAFTSLQGDGFFASAGDHFDVSGGYHDAESRGSDRYAFFTCQEEAFRFDASGNLHSTLAVCHSGVQSVVDELKAKLQEFGFTTEDHMPERPRDGGTSLISPDRWKRSAPTRRLRLLRPDEVASPLN
jgi:hypothetical protein